MRIAEAIITLLIVLLFNVTWSELAQLALGLDAAWFVPRASTLSLFGGDDQSDVNYKRVVADAPFSPQFSSLRTLFTLLWASITHNNPSSTILDKVDGKFWPSPSFQIKNGEMARFAVRAASFLVFGRMGVCFFILFYPRLYNYFGLGEG